MAGNAEDDAAAMNRATSILRLAAAGAAGLYLAWLGMLALHEAGHVLHAWVSGGRVVRVSLPLLGFSQTIVHPNPRELLVVWGGPAWGSLLPLIACAIVRAAWRNVPAPLRFFAGFCLIANGAYLGVGWTTAAGDAGDLVRLGTPVPVLIGFGVACTAAGLWMWHHVPFPRLRQR